MIKIDEIRQNTNHPSPAGRHFGRASCDVGGQRFETKGPGHIYKVSKIAPPGVAEGLPSAISPTGGPTYPGGVDGAMGNFETVRQAIKSRKRREAVV